MPTDSVTKSVKDPRVLITLSSLECSTIGPMLNKGNLVAKVLEPGSIVCHGIQCNCRGFFTTII